VDDRPGFRLPHPPSQRGQGAASGRRDSVLEAKARARADPQRAGLHRGVRDQSARAGPAWRGDLDHAQVHRRSQAGDLWHPAGVTIAIESERVTVNGPKGELWEKVHRDIRVEQIDDQVVVTRPTDRGEHRALHGLTRTLVANMVHGVTDGFEKRLEIQGVGYRAQLRGRDLELALGYSHPVSVKAPDGIEFEVPQPTRIVVRGASKQQVGEVAA